MRVFLAGATGAIGTPLLQRMLEDGHEVTALTRSSKSAERLRASGARATVCDALHAHALRESVSQARPAVVIHQLTAIPRRIRPRRVAADLELTNRLRIEATGYLAAAAAAAGASRLITQSVAFAYAPGGDLATEVDPLFTSAPTAYRELVRAVEVAERTTLGTAGVEGVALRYGFFYGPGTAYAADGSFADDVRRRRVPIIGDGGGVFSFIHVGDAAAATARAVTRGGPGIYNVVDDAPAVVSEWLPEYARLLDAGSPRRVPTWVGRLGAGLYGVYLMTRLRGASNEKAKTELAWRPRYSSWREGFAAELAAG